MSYDTLIQGKHARVAWAEVLDESEVQTSTYAWTYLRANLRLGPGGYARAILRHSIHRILEGEWKYREGLALRFQPGQPVCFRHSMSPERLEDAFFLPNTQLILARRLPVRPDNPTLIAHLLKEYPT